MGDLGQLLHRLDPTADVRHQGDRDQGGAIVDRRRHRLEIDVPPVAADDAYAHLGAPEPDQIVERPAEVEVVGDHVAAGGERRKTVEDDLLAILGAMDEADLRRSGSDHPGEERTDLRQHLVEIVPPPAAATISPDLFVAPQPGLGKRP